MVAVEWRRFRKYWGKTWNGCDVILLKKDRNMKRLMNTVIHECLHARDPYELLSEQDVRRMAAAAADTLWRMGFRPTRTPWKS